MTLQPPFAIFVTATDIDVNYINESLTRAWKGASEMSWDLWVASNDYNDAPKCRTDNRLPDGSRAPISEDYSPDFIGMTLEKCAEWLQNAPDDVALHDSYFAALDKHSKEDDTVMLCRIVAPEREGEINLQYFPVSTDHIQISIVTASGNKFDEMAHCYRATRSVTGKPDRSKG